MSERAAVAVVIPVYNRQRRLTQALESVAPQLLPHDQLVVVDDGSTDKSADVAEQWLAKSAKEVRYVGVRQPNAGAAAARNRGVAEAGQAELIVFLDSDDALPNDFVNRCYQQISASPEAIAVSGDQLFVQQGTGESRLRSLAGICGRGTEWLLENDGGVNSATMIRKRAFDAVSGFDSSLPVAEDLKFYLHLSMLGTWLYAPGQPSRIARGESIDSEESGPLSDMGVEGRLYSARVLEEFVTTHEATLSRAVCQDVMARIWYQVGRDLLRNGDTQRARECLYRCHQWDRWHLKAWWQRAIGMRRGG